MGESFWQKDSLITHILFELWLITLLWIVSVFLTQTLDWLEKELRQLSEDFLSCFNLIENGTVPEVV